MKKAQAFKEILQELKAKKILNKKFYSVEVGLYEINKAGLKHSFSRSYSKTSAGKALEFELLKNIMIVLANSIYISFENDYKTRAEVKGVHNYYNIILFKGKLYEVWYKVKETKDKKFFYDMGIIKEIK